MKRFNQLAAQPITKAELVHKVHKSVGIYMQDATFEHDEQNEAFVLQNAEVYVSYPDYKSTDKWSDELTETYKKLGINNRYRVTFY